MNTDRATRRDSRNEKPPHIQRTSGLRQRAHASVRKMSAVPVLAAALAVVTLTAAAQAPRTTVLPSALDVAATAATSPVEPSQRPTEGADTPTTFDSASDTSDVTTAARQLPAVIRQLEHVDRTDADPDESEHPSADVHRAADDALFIAAQVKAISPVLDVSHEEADSQEEDKVAVAAVTTSQKPDNTNKAEPTPEPAAPAEPPADAGLQYRTEGQASWYGPGFAGRPTASGEIYDPQQMTAASTELPLGTIVEVTAHDTGHTVQVRVNDRGPYEPVSPGSVSQDTPHLVITQGQWFVPHPERILDLSAAAAQRLHIKDQGVGQITVRVISTP